MHLLGAAGEGLPVAPLDEPPQESRVELASSAGAVTGAADLPAPVADWKAAVRFNGCATTRVDAI
jgi:hypothetical protein